jgi:hypothetical protein
MLVPHSVTGLLNVGFDVSLRDLRLVASSLFWSIFRDFKTVSAHIERRAPARSNGRAFESLLEESTRQKMRNE